MSQTVKMLAPAVLVATCVASPARAGFDELTGKVTFEGSALGLGLDAPPAPASGVTLTVLGGNRFEPLPDDEVRGLFGTEQDEAIEGRGWFELGAGAILAYLDLRSAVESLRGRRVEIRVWQRARGTDASLSLQWYGSGVDDILAGQFFGAFPLGSLSFRPTGRATDDGWEEWSTGPVDFTLAHRVDAALIQIVDRQLTGLQQRVASYDPEARVRLDGLEVTDLGPAQVPESSCRLGDEAVTCGDFGVCAYGRCADAAAVLGGTYVSPRLRDEYGRRRLFELRHFQGGRRPIAETESFADGFIALGDQGVSAKAFQDFLVRAYTSLGDGHASAPLTRQPSSANAGICVHLGEADLLPGGGTAPMVFSAPDADPFVQQPEPGDVLVRADDMPIADWAPLAQRYSRYAGDPAGRALVSAPDLVSAALRAGSRLEFDRCRPAQPGQPCAAADVQTIVVDFAEATAGVWSGETPGVLGESVRCDFRFRSAAPAFGDDEYAYAGTSSVGGVAHLQINGVPSPQQRGGQAWFQSTAELLEAAPDRLILDQRLGSGGSVQAVDHLISLLVTQQDFFAMELYPQLDAPLAPATQQTFTQCADSPQSQVDQCGAFFLWRLGTFSRNPPAAAAAKLAILNGADVSGNDFTSKLLTYRASAETRIFGAAPTYGAFGVVWRRPALPGELSGGSLQVQDTVFLADPQDGNLDFTTAVGVPPDEVVLQRQSDAVRGVDTVLEAARAWVSQ